MAGFFRALVGLAIIGVGVAMAVYDTVGRVVPASGAAGPLVLVAIAGCVFVGGRIVRSAFRDATRPQSSEAGRSGRSAGGVSEPGARPCEGQPAQPGARWGIG